MAYESSVDAFLNAGDGLHDGDLDQEGEGSERGRTVYRKKAQLWIMCLEHQFRLITGLAGFRLFLKPQGNVDPLLWPLLIISPDQGSDGVAAMNFLKHYCHLNVLSFWDPNHGAWNDCKFVLKHVGLWCFVNLMALVFNLQHGPWDENRWFEELKAAAHEVKSHLGPSTPLFQWLLPRILEDEGSDSSQRSNCSIACPAP